MIKLSIVIMSRNSFANIVSQGPEADPELDTDFLQRELHARVPVRPRPTPGIAVPETAPPAMGPFPCHCYSSPYPHVVPTEDDSAPYNVVRMGSDHVRLGVKPGRTPQLPYRTRAISATSSVRRAPPPQRELVSWRYFGETDGVCGCFAARGDARTFSRAAALQARAKLVRETEEKPRRRRPRSTLFERSLTRPEQNALPVFACTDLREDEVSYLEGGGRIIPLKSSTLPRT